MRIVRFRPEHLRDLALQSEQQALQHIMERPEYGPALSLAGPAFTVMEDGPIACIGVQELTPFRAEAWALLSERCGPHLRPITKAVKGWLAQTHYRRIEASVATSFAQGHKWATLLGFEPEGPPRRAFMPDGGDAITYVLIKGNQDGRPANAAGSARFVADTGNGGRMLTTHALTAGGIERCLQSLRDTDARELDAAGIDDPFAVLVQSLKLCAWAEEACWCGMPIAMFGVRPMPGGEAGIPWMLATAYLGTADRIAVARTAVQVMRRMRAEYPVLTNIIHAANVHAIRFVEWLGFTVSAGRIGPGLAFRQFVWRR